MENENINVENVRGFKIRPIELVSPREKVVFSYSGLLFLLASIAALFVLVYMLFQKDVGCKAVEHFSLMLNIFPPI